MEAVRARWLSSGGVVGVVLFLLAGCVSTASAPSPTDPLTVTTTTTLPTTTTTVTLEQGLENYRTCLADRGVVIDEIALDGLGRPRMARAMEGLNFGDRETLESLDVCAPELSSGALDLSADPVLREIVQSNLEEYSECLRRQGVDGYPDPVVDFDGLGAPYPVDRIPWTDPDLPAAVTVCSSRLGASSPLMAAAS